MTRKISIVQYEDPNALLVRVSPLLCRYDIFGDARARELIGILLLQGKLKFYYVAEDQNRPAGYIGWFLVTPDAAEEWTRSGRFSLKPDECQKGPAVMFPAAFAEHPKILRMLVRQVRRRYAGQRFYWRRVTPHSRVRSVSVLAV